MINGNGGGASGSGNAFDPTILANYATQEWVDDNYLSLDFFNSLFRAKTSGGVDVLPNDGDTSTIASIKAMFGFWTDQYISALGNGGGGGSTGALADLTDVAISNPQNNQVLAYNAATTHWVNVDMPSQYTLPTASASVLGGVKVGSTFDIDSGGVLNLKSGIATAGTFRSVTIDVYGRVTGGSNPTTLAGYGITDAKFGTVSNDVRPITLGSTTQNVLIAHQSLTGLASETWVSQNYVSIAFFNRLFQAYNGSTQVNANDTTTTIDNIKAMVGFWTEQYISALGNGSGGGSSTGALVDLTDVSISNPTDGQALVYDAATTHWKNATVAGSYTLPIATSSVLGGIKVGTTLQINSTTGVLDIASGYATQSWVNTQLGSYLPLSGGTLTGELNVSSANFTANFVIIPRNQNVIQSASGYQLHINHSNTEGVTLCYNGGHVAIGKNVSDSFVLDMNGWCNASGYYKSGSTNDYVLLGAGGHSQLKTINGYSIFGSGNIQISSTGGATTMLQYASNTSGASSIVFSGLYAQYGIVTGGSDTIFTSWLDSHCQVTYLNIPWNTDNFGVQLCYGVNSERFGYRTKYNGTWRAVQGFITTNGGTINGGDLTISGAKFTAGYIEIPSNQNILQSVSGYTLHLNYDRADNIVMCMGGGKVGIGVFPSYKLHVDGDIYATGGVTALSDINKKDVISEKLSLNVEEIALAPAIKYFWKDKNIDDRLHVGTSAQYWQNVLRESVLEANDTEHTLSMQYGVAALISAITIARKVVNHEHRLTELEKENAQLRAEISKLKAA